MGIIKTIFPCFPLESSASSHNTSSSAKTPQSSSFLNEKKPTTHDQLATDAYKTALRILSALRTTEKPPGPPLTARIESIVHWAAGWRESIARYGLGQMAALIKAGERMEPILKKAYDWAVEEARKIPGFVKDHPVWCTVVAVGVLLILAPYVLEVLGFGTLEAIGFGAEGPIEGEFYFLSYWWFFPFFSFFKGLSFSFYLVCPSTVFE